MRYRPNMDNFSFAAMVETIDKIDADTGAVVSQNFFPQREELPPVSNFDLATMVKAGVDLKKVNSKVLGSSEIVQMADALSAMDEQTNNNEVNNEQ